MVDDNKNFLKTTIKFLTENPDFLIKGTATNGEEAVSKVLELNPEIVLMDITMPGMSGYDATKKIKSLKNSPVVIMLTLHNSSEYRIASEIAGADGFISKSDLTKELLPVLNSFKEKIS